MNKTRKNKIFPRSTLKRIIKGHSDKSVGRNVDALVSIGHHMKVFAAAKIASKVYIDYVLFIQQ
jgi:hypothetical protein